MLNALFALLLLIGSAVADEETDRYVAAVRAACSEEWGTDYAMIEYCQNRQYEAMGAVSELLGSTKSDAIREQMLQQCIQEWPQGEGYDWAMAKYCYDRQLEVLSAPQSVN